MIRFANVNTNQRSGFNSTDFVDGTKLILQIRGEHQTSFQRSIRQMDGHVQLGFRLRRVRHGFGRYEASVPLIYGAYTARQASLGRWMRNIWKPSPKCLESWPILVFRLKNCGVSDPFYRARIRRSAGLATFRRREAWASSPKRSSALPWRGAGLEAVGGGPGGVGLRFTEESNIASWPCRVSHLQA